MSVVADIPTNEAIQAAAWRTSPPRSSGEIRIPRMHSSESSRALLGLLRLSQTAAKELNDGSSDTTFAGVISKSVLRSLLGTL
ncbi:MAG TPA: hypothetical protein VGM98_11450, partial [Schlesneria sp.]